SPVFVGRTVNGLLGSSGRMNGAHQTFYNAEVVVDNLNQWSQTVGGAGCVGNNGHVLGVFVFVYTNNECWSLFVLCRSGDNNLLCTSFDVCRSFLGGGEHTGGLYNILSAALRPWYFAWVFACVYVDCVAVDNKFVVFNLQSAIELAMHGV